MAKIWTVNLQGCSFLNFITELSGAQVSGRGPVCPSYDGILKPFQEKDIFSYQLTTLSLCVVVEK